MASEVLAGKAQSLSVEGRASLAEDGAGPPHWSISAHIVVPAVIAYTCVYFMRYPITMIEDIRNQEFGTVFGVDFLVKDSMSLAFLFGFGLAKIPAVAVMTTPLFFNNRFIMISLLNLLTGLLITLPLALSKGDPMWTTMGLFLGILPSSWVYGGMFTYFEGRTTTEFIVAFSSASLIMAGSLSRGTAVLMLNNGISEHWMPFIIFAVILLPMTIGYWYLDRSPKPNAYEVKHRKERSSMSNEKKIEFARDFAVPLVLTITTWSILVAMRQFRDLDARSLFKAANGGVDPPAVFVYMIDFLPAIASFCSLMFVNSIHDNYNALFAIFSISAGSLLFLLLTTGLFTIGAISGLVWQVTVAVGIFVAFAFSVPVWDRIVAVSPMGKGATSTFIMYTADMMGYVLSIAVVLWKRFAAPEETLEILLDQFIFVLTGGSILGIALLAMSMAYFWRRQRQEEDLLRVQMAS